MVKKEAFGEYEKYILSTKVLKVEVTTLGASCLSVQYHGRPLVLGYQRPEEYMNHSSYMGGIVGRFANRIAGASFDLNGRRYALTPNEHKNQLHGGPNAFNTKTWTAKTVGSSAVRFTLFSPDGENGYPGNLTAAVTYTVDGESLRLDFEGDCDADTVFAPTTHMFFNLGGLRDIRDTQLRIAADAYLSVDSELIPKKRLRARDEFDFSELRPIGQTYDHCFILDAEAASGEMPACVAEAGSVRMTLTTDFPALQLYTGEFLSDPHEPFSGLALEPEMFPDSPNRPDFPSPVLRRGKHFYRFAEYCFSLL